MDNSSVVMLPLRRLALALFVAFLVGAVGAFALAARADGATDAVGSPPAAVCQVVDPVPVV